LPAAKGKHTIYLSDEQVKHVNQLKKGEKDSLASVLSDALDAVYNQRFGLDDNTITVDLPDKASQEAWKLVLSNSDQSPAEIVRLMIMNRAREYRENHGHRQVTEQILILVKEISDKLIGNPYSNEDRKLYDALVDIRSRVLREEMAGVVRDLNFLVSVYQPPGEDGL
jgi:hypothetical protein